MENQALIVSFIGLFLSAGAISFAVWRMADEVNEQADKAEQATRKKANPYSPGVAA